MALDEIVAQLRSTVASGRPVVVAGVGCGLTASGAAEGGADVLATYSTAVYRRRGLPSVLSFLPYDNANDLTFDVAPEVLANARGRPVILGIGAHDPRYPIESYLDRVQRLGAAGVTNEPFAGMYGDEVRSELARAGLGFQRELELIERAVGRGLLTLGWVHSPEEARLMAEAGSHLIGAMLGLTGGGELDMDHAIERTDAMIDAAWRANESAIVLAHGGLLGSPSTVAAFLARSRSRGYVTGSSAERQPVISAVASAVRSFKGTGT